MTHAFICDDLQKFIAFTGGDYSAAMTTLLGWLSQNLEVRVVQNVASVPDVYTEA